MPIIVSGNELTVYKARSEKGQLQLDPTKSSSKIGRRTLRLIPCATEVFSTHKPELTQSSSR